MKALNILWCNAAQHGTAWSDGADGTVVNTLLQHIKI